MNGPAHLIPAPARAGARPAGRIPFAFGRRFYLVFLLGLVWTGPAWWDQRYLWGMAAWDLLALAAWVWDLGRLPRPQALELGRIWESPVTLDAESQVTVELRNGGAMAILGSLRDDVPISLRAEAPVVALAAAAGGTSRARYALRPGERGDARFGDAYLRYTSAWQLAERWAVAALPQTVRVYPNLEEAKRSTLYLVRSRQAVMERRVKRLRGHGREFESLREYRQGDEYRDICWTATARRGKPISKTYEAERSQTVWLVLDAGRLLRARVGQARGGQAWSSGLSKLDYAAGAALTLAYVALHSGDSVALVGYGRHVQQRVPPGRGPSQVRALLEALAQVHAEPVEANHILAAEALLSLQKQRCLVVWLTDLAETATTPEVVESAARLARRHLVLLAAMGQPEMRLLLSRGPESVREMYRYAAAQQIVQRRDLLLRGLRQQGALALEIEPARLSTALVNQYLAAKERSLI